MIQPHPPLLAAWNRQTQCPAVIPVEIPINQCPGIFLTPFPVLLVVTFPVLLVIMSPVLLVIIIPVLPALITLCIPIPNVVPKRKDSENKMSATATCSPLAVPLSPAPPKKCRIRRRRQAQRAANRNAGIISAAPLTQDERWANQSAAGHAGATQPQPEGSDPTSTRRTAVYPPSRIVGNSWTNENSPFQIGPESSRNPGLYKPAVPDPQQDTQAGTLRVKNSGSGTSSPPYLLPRAGIVYPLLPCAHRPDTSVTVDAALPEPAAFQHQDQPPTVVEIGNSVPRQMSPTPRRRAPRKPSRKCRRNRSTVVFRPAKHSPPWGHWCD